MVGEEVEGELLDSEVDLEMVVVEGSDRCWVWELVVDAL